MRKIILGIFVITAFFFGTSEIHAQCKCIKNYDSAYDEFKGSDAVFVGEVIEIQKPKIVKDTENYEFIEKFKVKTAWKTDSAETITLRNTASGSSEFKEGESYLVYARVRSNALRANFGCCTKTKPLLKAAKDLQDFEDNGEKQTNIIKTVRENNGKPNKSMDVRAKQRLCLLACPLNPKLRVAVSPHVISAVGRFSLKQET